MVKVRHGELGALAHSPFVGGQLPQDHLQQRGLTRAVGADQTDLVAAQDGAAELAHHGLAAIGAIEVFAHLFQLGHDLAAAGATGQVELHAAHGVAPLLALLTQMVKAFDARLSSGPASLDALANPHFFLSQQFVGTGVDDSLLRHLLFLLQLVLGEVTGVAQQPSTVQVDHSGGHVVQEGAVVADDDGTAFVFVQQPFQPADGFKVQMVGRLVQQQDVGTADQSLGQCHPFLQPARQIANGGLRVKLQALQGFVHPLLPVPGVK